MLAYSYGELSSVGTYVATHQEEIAQQVNEAVRRLPFLKNSNASESAGKMVIDATAYGTRLPSSLREALAGFSIAATIFIFTAFYILIEAENVGDVHREQDPAPLRASCAVRSRSNVRGVLYGAIYSTLAHADDQDADHPRDEPAVPRAAGAPLAVVSFIIGFFPIVGSWSVYVPVAIWLAIFRDATGRRSRWW